MQNKMKKKKKKKKLTNKNGKIKWKNIYLNEKIFKNKYTLG